MGKEMRSSARLSRFFAREAKTLRIELVYLFGSQAVGQSGPLSDVDIAILFAGEPLPEKRYALTSRLGKLLETDRLDLVVLNRAPIELKYSVIATGVPLHEVNRARRVEFEAQTLSRYFDCLPVLRQQRKELLEENGDYEARIRRYRKALAATENVLAQIRAA